jgi:hypothetical protein
MFPNQSRRKRRQSIILTEPWKESIEILIILCSSAVSTVAVRAKIAVGFGGRRFGFHTRNLKVEGRTYLETAVGAFRFSAISDLSSCSGLKSMLIYSWIEKWVCIFGQSEYPQPDNCVYEIIRVGTPILEDDRMTLEPQEGEWNTIGP